jgi:glycosyltransferase involved in cell wall biosynthesis
MNVVVNGRFFNRNITGVERYASEILCAMPVGVPVIRPLKEIRGLSGHLWEQLTLPRLIPPGYFLWSPANSGPLLVMDQVLTIHDLSPLDNPSWFTRSFAFWYRLFLPALLTRVTCVVVSSNHVREQLLARFRLQSDRVFVIPGGVDTEVFLPDAPLNIDLPAHYVLFVGSLQPRKNLTGLLSAWMIIKDQIPDVWLVIAGESSFVFRKSDLPMPERVAFLGYVPDSELPGLYASAEVLCLPSFDEGFGLPVLEAMACGVPVIASNTGALPEVVGDAGLLVKPSDTPAIANALLRTLQDKALRESLKARGLARAQQFTWQASASKIWSVFEECH